MTNSTLVCPVKIEYVTKNNIFGLKMMMKSSLEKKYFEIPPCASHEFTSEKRIFCQKYKFSNKNDTVCAWRNLEKYFSLSFQAILFFVTYSILTGQNKVEFVIYWVLTTHCTEVLYANLLSGGFTTIAVINPPERKLEKCTSVEWFSRLEQSTSWSRNI